MIDLIRRGKSVNSQISDVVIKGLTATNLFKTGNIATSVTGSGAGQRIHTLTNGTWTINYNYSTSNQTFDIVAGHKYFIKAKIKNTSVAKISDLAKILYWDNTVDEYNKGASTDTTYGIITATKTGKANVYFATAASGSYAGLIERDYQIFIDLTANGLENKTEEELNKIFSYYIDGTKSTVSNIRLVSQGKNWFNKNKVTLNQTFDANGNVVTSTTGCISEYIPVTPSKTYVYNQIAVTGVIVEYDSNKNRIGGRIVSATYTPSPNAKYFRVRVDMSTLDIVQVELGTTTTAYEPYKNSTAYISAGGELRSVSSVKDELRVSEGQKIQRVSGDVLLNGSLNYVAHVTQTNTYYYKLDNWTLNNNFVSSNGIPSGSMVQQNNDGAYVLHTSTNVSDRRELVIYNNVLFIGIEKSKIDAMAGATTNDKFKAYLNQYPITLTYQLMQNIVTPIPAQYLLTFPGGTQYIEFITKDILAYSDKLNISNTSVPIKNLISINKIWQYQKTPVDLSKATVASGGLSLTIAGAVSGEIYEVEYEYDSALSTMPEVVIQPQRGNQNMIL